MPITKFMKGCEQKKLHSEGYLYQDDDALKEAQKECIERLGTAIHSEEEAYLMKHPEVIAMAKSLVSKLTHGMKRREIIKQAAEYFSQPTEVIDSDIRRILKLPPTGPYVLEGRTVYEFDDVNFDYDIDNILKKHYPCPLWEIPGTPESPVNTRSSSFLSFVTSESTQPTPERVPTPEPTISEIFFGMISTSVDKAIYTRFDDRMVLYDCAYVELQKAVEEAMEIPVIEIREAIADMFEHSWNTFELIIMEKDRIAAEIAWEKRMRKKLKRILRRQKNFKGYETPPTPKSSISSHPSYLLPPPSLCECQPQTTYNRYGKDRFGIYLPRETEFSEGNITATPVLSPSISSGEDDEADAKDESETKEKKKNVKVTIVS